MNLSKFLYFTEKKIYSSILDALLSYISSMARNEIDQSSHKTKFETQNNIIFQLHMLSLGKSLWHYFLFQNFNA